MSNPSEPEIQSSTNEPRDPGYKSVLRYLTYSATLPERALRSTSAMVGGALRESTQLLVPQAFRNSKSYEIFVTQMLDILTDDVGGVEREKEEGEEGEEKDLQEFVARKTVGNFVELAGMATLHLSPMTLLALVSDIAYGSKTYLHELGEELKREGVIGEDSTINNATDLLNSISDASGVTASAFDLPPLSVSGLKETIQQTRDAVSKIDPTKIIPQSELDQLWHEMQGMAAKEDTTLFEVSSTMTMYSLDKVAKVGKGALSTVKVAGNLFDKHIFEHYWSGLGRNYGQRLVCNAVRIEPALPESRLEEFLERSKNRDGRSAHRPIVRARLPRGRKLVGWKKESPGRKNPNSEIALTNFRRPDIGGTRLIPVDECIQPNGTF